MITVISILFGVFIGWIVYRFLDRIDKKLIDQQIRIDNQTQATRIEIAKMQIKNYGGYYVTEEAFNTAIEKGFAKKGPFETDDYYYIVVNNCEVRTEKDEDNGRKCII